MKGRCPQCPTFVLQRGGEVKVLKKNIENSMGLHFAKTNKAYKCLTAAQELLYTGEEQ